MRIDVSVEVPPLPANWSGTPDELFQYLSDNGIFQLDGAVPSGQVGGSKPAQDVGIWYGDNSIERFRDGKYRPISDVPIGATLNFAGIGAVAPENYLFCVGQSVLRADYPELFTVIGAAYGSESPTTFTIPDYRGRVAVGAGIGDYIKQRVTGRMREVAAGVYSGFEWPRNLAKAPGTAKTAKTINGTGYITNTNVTETFPPRLGQQVLIRCR